MRAVQVKIDTFVAPEYDDPPMDQDEAEAVDAVKQPEPMADLQSRRLQSLDAYRGLIMISLSFAGFGLAKTATAFLKDNPDSGFWAAVKYQFSHAAWVGCSYWDLIQPSFMFMVGVSMAYSYVNRRERGDSYGRMLGHAVSRSIILILLSIYLMSQWRSYTNWGFMNVLGQIGLGYTFLFLLWGRATKTHIITAASLLIGTWLIYVAYPGSGVDPATGNPEVEITKEWSDEHLEGIRPSWHKNANVGLAVDVFFLNLFPQQEPYKFSKGGYQTINFIPSLATMLFGLMCGELLRSQRSDRDKLKMLLIAGVSGLIAGQFLNLTGICPLVKRIWTPSWALFSTGWCCLILGGLFWLIDVKGYRRWTYPLVVVGMNSIAIYCMSMSLKPYVARQWQAHLGKDVFTFWEALDPAWAPCVQACLTGMTFWIVCWYLYRKKIFIRI